SLSPFGSYSHNPSPAPASSATAPPISALPNSPQLFWAGDWFFPKAQGMADPNQLGKGDAKGVDVRMVTQQRDHDRTIRRQVEKCAAGKPPRNWFSITDHFLAFSIALTDSLHGLVGGKKILEIEMGSVLVSGGSDASNRALATAEICDLTAKTFAKREVGATRACDKRRRCCRTSKF